MEGIRKQNQSSPLREEKGSLRMTRKDFKTLGRKLLQLSRGAGLLNTRKALLWAQLGLPKQAGQIPLKECSE